MPMCYDTAMAEEPENLVLAQLQAMSRDLRAGLEQQDQAFAHMTEAFSELRCRMREIERQIGELRSDIARLKRDDASQQAQIRALTERVARIEARSAS